MLVHGYQQVRRLARHPLTVSLHQFVHDVRAGVPRLLDAMTVRTMRGIAAGERFVDAAAVRARRVPRPGLRSRELAREQVARIPFPVSRGVELGLLIATAAASVVLAVVLIGGLQSASGHLIDFMADAVGGALDQLELGPTTGR